MSDAKPYPATDAVARIKPQDITGTVYLMPFSASAAIMYHVLKSNNVKVTGFIDNNAAISGKTYDGCGIITPSAVAGHETDAAVILCVAKYYDSNESRAFDLGFSRVIRMERILTPDQADAAIKELDREALLSLVPKQKGWLERYRSEIRHYLRPDSALKTDALIVDRVELVVTEKCTLKCSHCANMMQYFSAPRTLKPEQICEDFRALMKRVDFIKSFNIIGGEPFLLKQLHEVIACVMEFRDKIESFEIITNGTIVPKPEILQAFTGADYIRISDYGSLSGKKDELVAALNQYGVRYSFSYPVWRDVQKIVDPEGNDGQKMYEDCHAHCKTVKEGRLYKCPFLAHGEVLGAFPFDERNHVNLDENCTKEDIRRYIEAKKAPPGCYYCNGNYSKDAPEVPVAVQIKEPVPYKRYGEPV